MNQYKILLVDDETLLLDSLEIILTLNGFEIAGKAKDGLNALKALESTAIDCDIALIDLNMKGMGGLELIKIMKKKYPNIKILVLTTFYDDKNITEAIIRGADGYLLKDSGRETILDAINQIMGGITVLDQKVMTRLAHLMIHNANITEKNSNKRKPMIRQVGISEDLTHREKEICILMVEGLTNKQIAQRLYISEGTVKNYISNIYDKTGIHDRVKLIVELRNYE